MSSKEKAAAMAEAHTFNEIAYAAFSTHFRTVYAAKIPMHVDPHGEALKHWNANLPHVQTLWHGLVKGIVANIAMAQRDKMLPPMIETAAAPPSPLPGLGGPALVTNPGPAALARDMAAKFRQDRASKPADTPPGLAVGRETGDES